MSFSLPPQKPIRSGFAVGKYEQDAKGAAFPTGAYIGVRDQGKTQTRQSIAKYFTGKKMRPACNCTQGDINRGTTCIRKAQTPCLLFRYHARNAATTTLLSPSRLPSETATLLRIRTFQPTDTISAKRNMKDPNLFIAFFKYRYIISIYNSFVKRF